VGAGGGVHVARVDGLLILGTKQLLVLEDMMNWARGKRGRGGLKEGLEGGVGEMRRQSPFGQIISS